MDIRHLRHFVAIVEHKSMLQAAEAIHVTQPALSKSIKTLEESLGVRLLDRSSRGMTPTVFGLELLKHAKLILNQTEKARAELQLIAEGSGGHLRIGFGANIAGEVLARALLTVVESRPRLTASVLSRPFDELLRLLKEGELDLAFVVFPPEPPDDSLVYDPLIVNEFQVVCRPQHPAARQAHLSWPELAAMEWVLFDRPISLRDRFNAFFIDADLPAPTPKVRTTSVFLLKWLVENGDYLTYVPSGLFYDELGDGRLAMVPSELEALQMKAGVVYRRNDILPAAAQEVIDELHRLRGRYTSTP